MALLRQDRVAADAGMKGLFWVVVAGVAARVAMVALSPAHGGMQPLEPSVIAANLNAGNGFSYEQYGTVYRAWKEPLYIVLLAWLTRWVGEWDVVVVLFQSVLGIGAAMGIALIAWRLLGDRRKAMVAGVLAAANPFLIYYDTRFIHPLSLDALLFVTVVGTILLVTDRTRQTLPWAILAGVVMGVALWERAVLLAAGLAAWLIVVWRAGAQRKTALVCAGIWCGIAMLIVSPWLVRNYRLFGRVVITTDAAHIFWLGNNPLSNGTYSDMAGERIFDIADPAFQQQIVGAPELVQYERFLGEAWRFVREHPERFGALVLRRLWAFVWFSPNAGVTYTAWQGVLYRVAYTILLALGGLGLIAFWRRAPPDRRLHATVMLGAVLGLAAVHALTAINMKHRVPLELVLAVFAAESLTRIAAGIRLQWTR